MALFAVNRYVEDEQQISEKCQEDNLLRLKDKIEERRKAKRTLKGRSDTSDVPIDTSQIENVQNDVKEFNETVTDRTEEDIATISRFKVLGVKDFEKKSKVKRVLPYWLAHPNAVSVNLKTHNLNIDDTQFLHNCLKKKLVSEGVEYLFPVQAEVIPWLLRENKKSEIFWPRDVCVSAPTGSGKTLAYVLPIVQILSNRVDRQIRALVVLPVKELAAQVAKVFKDYCVGTNLKIALITGLVSLQQEQSQLVRYSDIGGWQSEVDVMICTAGRLVEHINSTEGFTLKHLRFLVIDEADRIMQHVQNDWLHHLNQHVEFGESFVSGKVPILNFKTTSSQKRPPQKLLFSATLSQDPEKLKEWSLFQPKLFSATSQNLKNVPVDVVKYTTPLELSEKYVICDVENKPAVLYCLLKLGFKKVLCFINSAQAAHRLTIVLKYMLNEEMQISEISAALGNIAREAVLKKFKSGDINVLISTDALARGIDIVDCDSVISYDPPRNIKTYIHRVGRTSRAGREGTAFAILTQNQLRPFKEIIKASGKLDIEKIDISVEKLKTSTDIYSEAMIKSKNEISKENSEHVNKLKSIKRGRSAAMFKKRRKEE